MVKIAHLTFREHTLLRAIVVPVQLHSHHGEDEDDDTEDHNQVRDGGHSALHDSQDVIERLP